MKNLLLALLLLASPAYAQRFISIDAITIKATPAKVDTGYVRGYFNLEMVSLSLTRLATVPVASVKLEYSVLDYTYSGTAYKDDIVDYVTTPFPSGVSTTFVSSRQLNLSANNYRLPYYLIVQAMVLYTDGSYAAASYISPIINSASPSAPLPVVLTRFDAANDGGRARLAWQTSSEVNARAFEVEKSTDGVSWQYVATVLTGPMRYTYFDQLSGRTYYRLKMLDYDGSFSYSPVRVVDQAASAVTYYNTAGQRVSGAGGGVLLQVLQSSQGSRVATLILP